jgi:Fur family peroxide stress response transcriptional regulator
MDQRHRNDDWAAAFHARCRAGGLKVTPQRTAIYRLLGQSKEHPSADALWRRARRTFPGISLDTVNRTLLTFAEMGLAFVVEGSGDVRRYDADLGAHQHFKCIECKRVVDFHYQPFDDIRLPPGVLGKCKVLRKSVYLEGICDRCCKRAADKRVSRREGGHL